MAYANIVSTGIYLPEIEVSNDALRARFDKAIPEFVDKMEASSGIRTRWNAPEDWATSDLAARAAKQALERAGKRPDEVDLVIVGTDSPDFITPATSVIVQDKIGAKNAGTFDVGCACASFPTAFTSAAGMMATNANLKTVVVIGVYLMHKLTDPNDPMIFFYGDGAGAAVLERRDEPGFISSAFRADGSYAKRWAIFAGGTVEPTTAESLQKGHARVKMYDRYPPEINNEGWPAVVREVAKNGGFAVERHRLRHLHAGAPADDRIGDGRSQAADGKDAHGHGEMGLYRVGVYSDGAARRLRAEEDQAGRPGRARRFRRRIQPGRGGVPRAEGRGAAVRVRP